MSESNEDTRQRLIRDGLLKEDEPIRNQAVAIIDAQNGYSVEFDPDPNSVRAEYDDEQHRLAEQIACSLSPAQLDMLCTAARRPKENRKRTRETNYAIIGPGQASTAKKLESLRLGKYVSNGYSANFWIGEHGYEVAASVGATPPEGKLSEW